MENKEFRRLYKKAVEVKKEREKEEKRKDLEEEELKREKMRERAKKLSVINQELGDVGIPQPLPAPPDLLPTALKCPNCKAVLEMVDFIDRFYYYCEGNDCNYEYLDLCSRV